MPETTIAEPPTVFRPHPKDRAPAGTVHRAAEDFIEDLPSFIAHLEATAESAWCTDVVRSPDGAANCVFGHLFQYATDHAATVELPAGAYGRAGRAGKPLEAAEVFANAVWNVFEERWSSTFFIYRVNDGQHPGYPQPTPKGRVIAYLRALAAGEEDTTLEAMDRQTREIEAYESAQAQRGG